VQSLCFRVQSCLHRVQSLVFRHQPSFLAPRAAFSGTKSFLRDPGSSFRLQSLIFISKAPFQGPKPHSSGPNCPSEGPNSPLEGPKLKGSTRVPEPSVREQSSTPGGHRGTKRFSPLRGGAQSHLCCTQPVLFPAQNPISRAEILISRVQACLSSPTALPQGPQSRLRGPSPRGGASRLAMPSQTLVGSQSPQDSQSHLRRRGKGMWFGVQTTNQASKRAGKVGRVEKGGQNAGAGHATSPNHNWQDSLRRDDW